MKSRTKRLLIVLPTLLLAGGSVGRVIAQTENIGSSSGAYLYGSSGSGTVTTAPYIYGTGNPGPSITYSLGGSLSESGGANSGGSTGSKGNSPEFGNGGNGGQGASPGSVTVVLSSGVSITVNDANLIDGFDNVVGGIASAQAGNGGDGGNAGIGGSGGSGGAGGSSQNQVVNLNVDSDVSVNVSIDSTEYGAIGLLSQSVGGVGGDGGDGGWYSTGGGDGGNGGYSGLATVTNAGSIVVNSENDAGPGGSGILVQSVGGQGGATGSGGLITYGGQGGTGGTAGNVSVTNTGTVSATGDSVTGINVQSIGGGGGAVAGGLSVANLGGSSGGVGGDAGVADLVMTSGSVTTDGNNAQGILVQAVGGGGGSVGNQTSLTTVGSEAGGGGNGGSASLTFTGGSVITGASVSDEESDGDTNVGSTGILVQSIGGGGGNAGTSSGMIAVGSSGGDGGNGGSATAVLSNGSVFTEQDYAGAVVVQSIGGGGGNGGNANSAGAGASVAVGGNAGGGGVGGNVSVGTGSSESGAISLVTMGFQAPGLLVQSIGGSGGTGGSATSVSGSPTASYSLAVGGDGGTGGNAGTVTVGSTDLPFKANVSTLGAYSTGVSINSIGGGGGNGGNAVSGSVSAQSFAVGVGGTGGAAGNGASVSVVLEGELRTEGFQAPGLQVQSIGGGGGNGGSSMAVSGGAVAAAPSVGGTAGAGGNAGDVTVSFSGPIETRSSYSPGTIVSSIGGGGGTGGSSLSASAGTVSASVAVGGDGGAGGSGGNVSATLAGDITTHGESSPGALIQSVGGGGGAGGSAVSGSMTAGVVSGGVAVALGGNGGSGNSAGSVSLTFSDSSIKTGRSVEGILIGHSPALLVQSVGGGGGQGGSSVSGSVSLSSDGSFSGSFGLGGSGGDGGTGGAVTVSLTNMVLDTLGDYSAGLIAQSIGGGGGQGGSSTSMQASASSGTSVAVGGVVGGSGGGGANAGSVSVANSGGSISTKGDFAPGLYIQSVGGGGGSGGSTTTLGLSASSGTSVSGSVSIGGSGGSGGTGGAVTVTDSSRIISTKGDHSPGIVAQSIGGGGGTGGSTTTLSGSAGGSTSVSGGVSLGGDGGSGSSAGDVSLTTSGVVITGDTLRPDLLLPAGAFSYGILAQSVGGGGGAGGSTSTYSLSASTSGDAVTLGADFGGDGGDGGTGGNVSVTVSGSISTVGFQATGLLAQSVGGGGGAGGSTQSLSATASKGGESYTGSLSVGMGGSGGDGQAAGAVIVEGPDADSLLRISTSGVMALGLNAQSIGGGGGQGGSSMAASITESPSQYSFGASAVEGGSGGTGGTGGSVQLGTSSTNPLRVVINTTGLAADAVLAQSVGGGGGAGGGAISSGNGGSFSTNMSFGAQGGAGGTSGSVNVYLLGDISTRGTHSSGLTAQSVGGGGGAGGSAISGSTTGDADVDFSFGASVSDGGDGGGGGDAGPVSVSFGGSISTRGVGADGLFIQSVGGGGGRGGAAISSASSSSTSSDTGNSSTSTSGSATMSFGGEGGDGGDGGSASLQALSDIKVSTRGTNAAAITVQSIGGGGGRGGKANANSTTDGNADFSFGASAASGGDGGSGGSGGSVSLGSSSTVMKAQASTLGDNAIALLLQSVGGGGGIGGSSQAGASGGNLSASFAMGGDGGNGGTGGAITVFTDGTYITQGTLSHAVLIQSIGGGGGQGGSATSNADPSMSSEDDSTSADSDFSFGASGGSGGDGGGGGSAGSISGSISGLIRTIGDSAIGLFAQSVGGGGGAGGAVTSGASSGSGNLSASASFAMGGDGGNGGRGGSINLDVPNGLQVATGDSALGTGHGSHGILLQSIGGGGGTGGSVVSSSNVATNSSNTSMSFGLSTGDGGDGGYGANSGSVNLGSSRSPAGLTVETNGDNAMAVFLQSVGGGGGAGGAVNATTAGGNLAASFAMGGDGGVGGTGGAVSLFADGTYLTRGATSHGVLLQSVGGGGGQGGAVTANATPVSSDDSANASFSFGASAALSGSGGRGGNGGRVTAGLSGTIRTLGDSAIGLFVQSVGGGGGAGGSVTNVADSGGGELSASTTMSMGGAGGSGGSASSVELTTPAELTVITGDSSEGNRAGTGHGSHAVLLQSVGGGGGQGGSVVSGTTAGTSTSNSSFSFGATLATSGSGGAGGAGGRVSLGSSGQRANLRLQTSGDNAHAVFLQSVGGGGGAGGSVNSSSAGGNLSASFALGGPGGNGGTASDVAFYGDGTFITTGNLSHGVLLQSVGGGGGAGGSVTSNADGTGTANSEYSFGASAASGGNGAGGGWSGSVTGSLSGRIVTTGQGAIGVFAQSIAGGGGAGGSVTSNSDGGNANVSAAASFSMGGAGGSGGSAGSVSLFAPDPLTVITGDSTRKTGSGAHAILLQSVGGGGGTAGSVLGSNVSASTANSSFSLGASAAVTTDGGNGGTGGDVSIGSTNQPARLNLVTSGHNAHALFLQSVGGGGGSAGTVSSGNATGNLSASYSMGGAGGDGGQSGQVSAYIDGTIVTTGDNSHGFLLQVVGGGGGQGGSVTGNAASVAGTSSGSIDTTYSFGLSLDDSDDSSGGNGGIGGRPTGSITGNVITRGDQSIGVLIQSIGGGGGAGGTVIDTGDRANATYNSVMSASMGSDGGSGGDSGRINLSPGQSRNLTVLTSGEASPAVLLQSIGGGGGQAGTVIAKAKASSTEASLGGGGGDAGAIQVNLGTLQIQTTGNNSNGLTLQSIGGGGGAVSHTINNQQSGVVSLDLAIGSSGGDGGDGNNLNLSNEGGRIVTSGAASTALLLQSIGGGGGLTNTVAGGTEGSLVQLSGSIGGGGGNGGNAGSISATNASDLVTTGVNAIGLYAQSIGGGGGGTGVSLADAEGRTHVAGSLQIGGTGGSGGTGGAITLTNSGTILTTGSQSHGLFGQSIGAGGGRLALAGGGNSLKNSATLQIGGDGGNGGNGGTVAITNSGAIEVRGQGAYGLGAQSLGGGGGSVSSTSALSFSLGASGGIGGDSSAITITNSAPITTTGRDGIALSALSIGGGGGDAGLTRDAITLGSRSGSSGNAGAITITNSGALSTSGVNATGLLARSVGGGGGRVTGSVTQSSIQLGASGGGSGSGGGISITNRGRITTSKRNANAIAISSIGGGGGEAASGYGNASLGSINASGIGGAIRLTNSATLITEGIDSAAMLVQSIGGGGGSIDHINGDAQLGSRATTAAQSGGSLNLTNSSDLQTSGSFAPIVMAQSVGGGGGHVASAEGSASLGNRFSADGSDLKGARIQLESNGTLLMNNGDYSPALVLQSIGGGGGWIGPVDIALQAGAIDGAGSMAGGDVNASNRATIITRGANSGAISLQSIGGGGGSAGSVGTTAQLGSINSGGSQTGGSISLTNRASLYGAGDHSPLINLQSIGGGGGFAGAVMGSTETLQLGSTQLSGGVSDGGSVSLNQRGEELISRGNNSAVIRVQSIGGGGGAVASNFTNLSFGTSGRGTGSGGAVTVTNQGVLISEGRNAMGLLAQSIGGGGGLTGLSSGSQLTLGGSLQGRGNGGAVTVTNTGAITTLGINSAALLAQSIGGGGGTVATASGASTQLGGSDATLANAADVSVTNRSSLQTAGNGSPTLMVQSIGGGGGFVAQANPSQDGTSLNVTLGGSNLGQANAGRVQLNTSGERLLTTGAISPALVAQSVGGGGGWSLLPSTASAQLGSGGGTGLQGNTVNVTNTAPILTSGNASAGAVIQSIGGGGGVGGNTGTSLSLGASRAQGQLSARTVSASQTGSVTTLGRSSAAVVVQSIGGGGGLGASTKGDAQLGQSGSNSNARSNSGAVTYQGQGTALQTAGVNAPALVVQSIAGGGGWIGTVTGNATLGSQGSGSGTAGAVEVISNHDAVTTEGRNSAGLLVQSIGGGGGYTGLTLGDDLTLGANQQGTTVGGAVDVTNRSSITTTGLNAVGLMAQSVGGGGGTSATGKGSTITLGASGQGNADAGAVKVSNSGVIQTEGEGSAALIAQSIAGGGGFISEANGTENYTLTFGATGNVAGQAGAVRVNNTARLLSTRSDEAPVVIAQSIAGGGGYALVNATDRASTRLGTNGSNSNSSAGDVTVTNRSDLVSLGDNATALTVQSIGGGGGVMASAAGSLQLGGADLGAAAQGGSITVTNSGNIETLGQTASAVIVQSIGGGGGSAGGSGGTSAQLGATNASSFRGVSSGDVQLTSNGTSITTRGLGSAGLVVQSIAGGGGRMGSSTSPTTLGGSSLQTANSGSVDVVNRSTITTLGGGSAALVAQSLAGGGGIVAISEGRSLQMGGSDLGVANAGTVSVTNTTNLQSQGRTSPLITVQSIGGGGGFTTIANNPTFSTAIVLGSDGLKRGHGGTVSVTNSGRLVSNATSSSALVVQSIGGGGGIARRLGTDTLSFDLQLGSSNAEDASGGNVDVTNNGKGILTTGSYARPILVQSIGGGGGWITANVGAITEALLGSTAAGGNTSGGDTSGGEVSVTNNAPLTSLGTGAAGLVAQSIGGGGGVVGNQAGTVVMGSVRASGRASGGSVDLTNTAAITTKGTDAPAAFAQSIGGGGGRSNDIAGNLRMGIVGNKGSLAANGSAVTLINRGSTVLTSGANSGGLIAQSIGGGGGYAGSQTSDDAIGRLGGGTDLIRLQDSSVLNGGDVSLSNRATVVTEGLQSPGLLAQSIGGGGGFAGRLSTRDIRFGLHGQATANSGAISVTNTGSVATMARGSSALIAQSVAGGGGFASASDSAVIHLGARQALMAKAGAVTVTNSNTLETLGSGAVGLLAQSVGGGGGFLADVRRSERFASSSSFSLGSINSTNSSTGDINVENNAERIVTRGDGAAALLVQSVGGGGGWTAFDQNQIQQGHFGQQGGSNAKGGDLTVTTSGSILTLGDDSQAIRLQSIGGGGGASSASIERLHMGSRDASGSLSGGAISFTNSGTVVTRGGNAAAIALLSLGGGGGTLFGNADTRIDLGATGTTGAQSNLSGGAISAINRGDGAFTEGQNAPALVLQSIGGGGGMIDTLQGKVRLGSSASEGRQQGGAITITNEANLNTGGNNSAGLIAQSIGGGGGFSALRAVIAREDSLVLGSSFSSQSSSGGSLSLSTQGRIITAGAASPGLVAQSIGGGGGSIQGLNAARTGALVLGSRSATNANSGVLELTPIRGTIATSGSRSAGAVVQSIGGGGGWALVDSLSTTTLGATSLSGGSGGAISVVLDGRLQTTGAISPGIVVQSVGGGGGFAGNSQGDAGLGSSDSSGDLSINGSSGLLYPVACPVGSCPVKPVEQAVLVDIQGAITTTGTTSPVMVVQAIGGGGGRLSQVEGDAVLGMEDSTGTADGGSIRVISNGGASLTSLGDHSPALMVQSIGGGGGSINDVEGALRLGSQGQGSSTGGSITLNGPFTAITQGEESPGVVLQAIGGGGGYASDVAGNRLRLGTLSTGDTAAGAVRAISANWQISTEGVNSPGLILQSIGGGGGVAYTNGASVSMGGDVVGITRADAVSLISKFNSRIQTTGSSSPAVIAQSIGGGGGYVGGDGSGRAPVVDLGGGGTQLGGSGSVELTISRGTQLITAGTESQGILAQSIGGGGGYTSQNGLVLRLGMTGGRGNAGDVTVDNQGSITTLGSPSEGILAQSIGAGGGSAGNSQTSLALGADNAIGDAGNVVVNNRNGRINTTGSYSIGVVAQSVGGGGGRIGRANGSMTLGANNGGGNAGNVTLNNAGGVIATSGAYAPAYLMQSVGGGGGQVGLGDSDGSGTVVLGGGVDGTYGSGGTLTLINAGGSLQAEGAFSPGVIHQSIGGGGGWIGNVSDGNVQLGGLTTDDSTGADLNLTLPFEVLTMGDNSPGVVLQSIGGGGGVVADVSGNATLGGTTNRGVDTSGGSLTYSQLQRSVTTLGNDSPGVVLQSIGGGGGLLAAVDGSVAVGSDSKPGSNVSAGVISASNGAPITTTGVSSPGLTIQSFGGSGGLVGSAPTSVSAGGSGRGDSRAGAIELTNRGAIITTGDNSSGVVLQSIGGGGVYTTSAGGAAIRLGGSVVGLNDSGDIAFTSRGTIRTGGDNAAAIVAQSIGGGGGAVFGVAGAKASSVQLGSATATSNGAGAVTITIEDDLSSFGAGSPAVLAQSIGGGGGYAPIASHEAQAGATTSSGLDGKAVSILIRANATTNGFSSDGLIAQSIGAGGGMVGSSTNSLQLGAGNGGNGDAAAVSIRSSQTITTTGDQSIGISAQSIGAGGGRSGSAEGSVHLGADGARGDAGTVTLNLTSLQPGSDGSIITTGKQSPAFVLQSIGGGGGLVFPNANTSSDDLLLGGGDLGSQGQGAAISFTAGSRSRVITTGDGSSGLAYQSIGGGGGYAGNTSTNAQLGGLYRGTSSGASLELVSQVATATQGRNASALLVQSIGGGGGSVGDVGGNANLGGSSDNNRPNTVNGSGGALNLTLNTPLTSSGDNTTTVAAQSIGGGGGTAGAIGGKATLGGLGTGNRSAGAISLSIDNQVGSGGNFSPALLAQSVGGGGGSVDTVGGNLTLGRSTTLTTDPNTGITTAGALNLTVNSGAQVVSTGNTSPAFIAQTIGGGGGFAASTTGSVQLGAGGAGTTAANAAAGAISWSNAAGGTTEEVTALGIVPTTTGGIATTGNLAPAVVLQSIGGGGGYTTGGTSVSFSAAGHAGSSTSSGDIDATNTGIISTTGDNSFGVLLQTIGGGGGVGGSSTGVVSLNNTNANSSSGNITFTNSGTIATSGTGSHAVVAQTIAGGGGFVFGGVNKEDSASLLGGRTGRSGDITITNSGTISASGTNAVGLLFLNATGGAYQYQNPNGSVSTITEGVANNLSPAGEVVVNNTGVIRSTGTGGVAITKSTSSGLHGNLRVDNAEGAWIQGGDNGAAINLPTVEVERITNNGWIVGGAEGTANAITGNGGPDEIKNFGVIAGDIIIPGITKNIFNAPGARLDAALVDANRFVTLVQSGLVNPNGPYRIGDLKVKANYATARTSLYEADLVLRSGQTDNLTTFFQANLNGTVQLLANQVGQAMPGSFVSEGIINAQEGITIGDLKLVAPKSAVASFGFDLINNRTDLAFKYTVDYAPKGLDLNSTAVGKAVNTIQAAGSTSAFNSTAALIFAQGTTKELNSLYRQLSGATSAAFPQVALTTGQAFQDEVQETLDSAVLSQLQRCILNVQSLKSGDTYTGDPADCGKWRTWVNAGGSEANTPGSGSSEQSGYSTNAFNTSVGADTLVGDNTLIGIA
ncbi:hypothetical protein, partial [Synechococcus sp. UW140]|uniref:hypothetical protein n=1 Tax=Synechococcus sp. UW140 TaxID=368503 RepID=UPI000E0EF7C8